MSQSASVQVVLISHTNNGKTTLVRTLTGIDVGEVRDAAHVTLLAESHLLLSTPEGDSLQLWDTPGFGDSVRLFKRLAMSSNPIGWFLREVFDRYRDRAFWLSQNALRAARDSADVVLYLVNASEDPRDAGYLTPEMKILEWLGKPVLVLLNQLGPPKPQAQETAEQSRWRDHFAPWPFVRGVLALDAFARCWMHERVLYEALTPLLAMEKQPAWSRLLAEWTANNERRFSDSMQVTAWLLTAAALDQEEITPREGGFVQSVITAVGLGKRSDQRRREQAMTALLERHGKNVATTTARLLELHKLDAREATTINARVRENFAVRAPVDKATAGLMGAIVSGATTGLGADLMAGGMTFGTGALVGGVVGALTMAGVAWGFNVSTDRSHPTVRFADEFLNDLLACSVLRYLAVAHFGRGRGNYVDSEAPSFWQSEVARSVAELPIDPGNLWRTMRAGSEHDAVQQALAAVTQVTRTTLGRLYPPEGAAPVAP